MGTERDSGQRPELPDRPMTTETPGSTAPWTHTAVHGRFRVRTPADRLQALREAFSVFMERTDGTNALDDEVER